MKRLKDIIVGTLLVLVIIVVFQNLDPQKTQILFWTIEMRRVVLLGIVFVIGFLSGMLIRLRLRSSKKS